jgi:acetylserotonin N-methyltransferase
MVHPEIVLDLIEAFRRSKAMFTAVSLGVFDRLAEAPSTAGALAAALPADEAALERLLDACTGLGLLEKQNGLYRNTPTAFTYLTRQSEQTLAGYVLYSDRVLYRLWGHLEDAVRAGTHRWEQAFNLQGPIFDAFFRTDEAKETFIRGMHGLGVLSSPAVVRVFNLNRFRTLCDLGGASGHLAIAACERYGALRGIVFDLPGVVGIAERAIDASPARDRLSVHAGDFFHDPLPPADLYAMGRILHDWSEPRLHLLLRRVFDALPPGGGLLIAEAILDEDKSGPVPAQMQSLNMLVCTEGRERTESEYRVLLQQTGFTSVEARRTGAPVDALLALK